MDTKVLLVARCIEINDTVYLNPDGEVSVLGMDPEEKSTPVFVDNKRFVDDVLAGVKVELAVKVDGVEKYFLIPPEALVRVTQWVA